LVVADSIVVYKQVHSLADKEQRILQFLEPLLYHSELVTHPASSVADLA